MQMLIDESARRPRDLELDGQRSVTIALPTGDVTYFFPRLTRAFLLQMARLNDKSGNSSRGRGVDRSSRALSAQVEFVRQRVQRVEGMEVKVGRDWRTHLPADHLAKAVEVLTYSPEVVSMVRADSGTETVTLCAIWGAGNEVFQFSGLKHRFPASGDARKLPASRLLPARAIVQRHDGQTSGASVRRLIEAYDTLIESVDGYTVRGAAPKTREDIAEFMDCMHKCSAVIALLKAERPNDNSVPAVDGAK